MGTSVMSQRRVLQNGVTLSHFYTEAAWMDIRATDQLAQLAGWPGMRALAAFPDLHPGKHGPVGCAMLADRIYPQLIGNDIGCGMALFQLDLPLRKIKLDKALKRLREICTRDSADHRDRLEAAGLPVDFASALGTIGGGNHFCEVQSLSKGRAGMDQSLTYLLVHSGSRGVGDAVLSALPKAAFDGMEDASAYLPAHDRAVVWARLNRQIIAERAAVALRAEVALIVDAPHNLLQHTPAGWLHRKGAAVADGLFPLAGSRDAPSFLLRGLGADGALSSAAHGAGRRYDRASMHGRVQGRKSDLVAMERNSFGGRILCEDRDLLIEEAPHAYKSSSLVVADLETTGAAECVAEFHPVLTVKKARDGGAGV